MRILVSLLLLLSACASEDQRKEPPVAPPVFTCNGTPDCAIMAGATLILTTALTSYSAAERRMRARQITGTCEVLLPQIKGKDPCGTILLTITDAKGGVRKAWIQDQTFEVGNLQHAPFTVVAESEAWDVSSKIENVKLGQQIKLQLTAKPRPGAK